MSCESPQADLSNRVNACRLSHGFDPAALLALLHAKLPAKPRTDSQTALRSEIDRHAAGMVMFRKIIESSRGGRIRFGILVSDFESETVLWLPRQSLDGVTLMLNRLRKLQSGDLIRVKSQRRGRIHFLTHLQPAPYKTADPGSPA